MKTLLTFLLALLACSCKKEQPKVIFESVTITDRGAPDPSSLPEHLRIDGMMWYPNTINERPTGPVLILKNEKWEIYKQPKDDSITVSEYNKALTDITDEYSKRTFEHLKVLKTAEDINDINTWHKLYLNNNNWYKAKIDSLGKLNLK